MKRTDAVILGGGQSGLAMSRCLSDRGIDHVVLERGRVGERWRSERWDSLRMLTPNWQSRLPGQRYDGPDPDGYMSMPEVIGYLERYARSFSAPVEEGTTVRSVERDGDAYRVRTSRGTWRAPNVVVATGACDRPSIPAAASRLDPGIVQVVPSRYRNPAELPAGGVLVVGASASGVQLADELRRAGRAVTLAVGRHTRLPRRWRGRDVLAWLDEMGVFDERPGDVPDWDASRRRPSLQLVGRDENLDLGVLEQRGVRLTGRLLEADGTRVRLADDLAASTALANARMLRTLQRIDAHIEAAGLAGSLAPAPCLAPVRPAPAPTSLDLAAEGIRTVLWATGFRRGYPWLRVPVLGADGEIRHRGGVTPAPGLYVMGLQFLRRRKSSFLDGAGPDAIELSELLARRLSRPRTAVA